MKKVLLLLALFIWTGLQVSFAQSRSVKGKVLDENGEGIPGASVKVKGTTTGTITDIDGNYELTLPDGASVLEIRGVGLESQDVTVGDSDDITTTLKAGSASEIGEIKIYGQTVDKRSFTGAVNTITAKDLSRRPVTDIARALEGAAPGVAVTSGGGQPGSTPDIQIRGRNTLSASSAPLIVLDGAPYGGSLASINPNDVESMTVLKDASATSIYGSRGSNGVILIVTKQGVRSGKPRIEIDASVGTLSRFLPLYETVGAKDYIETAFSAYANGAGSSTPNSTGFFGYIGNYNPYNIPMANLLNITNTEGRIEGTVNPDAQLLYTDSWLEEVSRVGIRHNYNISVSNGDDKSNYYFSAGYTNDQGIVKNSTFDRITARLNANSKINPWVRAGMMTGATFSNQRFFVGDQQAFINPFMTAQQMGAIYPVYRYDSNGNRMFDANGDPVYDFGVNTDNNNPSRTVQVRPFATNINTIASLSLDDRSNKSLNGFGNAFLEVDFLKDFNFRTNFIVNYLGNTQNQFQNMTYGDAVNVGGRMNRTVGNRVDYTFNQLLTWNPSFGVFRREQGHNLSIVLGHENYYIRTESVNLVRTGFLSSNYQEGEAGALGTGSTSGVSELAMESYFSMANYNYKGKYYLSASLRTDGSSRFSEKSRWGTFWSVGAGWMLSEEAFLSNSSWINALKFRGSYGITGNEALNAAGYYAWMPSYAFNPNNTTPGVTFLTWGNENLKWEGSYKFNIGFDFELYQNRLSGSIDYFNSGANNLLFVQPFAPSVGTGGIYSNVGSMANSGVELQVNGTVIRAQKPDALNWNVRVNLTHLRNKITKVQSADGSESSDSLIGSGTILAKGYAVNSFFLPEYAGVDPESGLALYKKADGSTTDDYLSLTRDDYRILGSGFRDLEGSVVNTFNYKGFELSFMLSFGLGGKFYDNTYANLMRSNRGEAYHVDILNRWKYPGDVTDVPRVEYGQENQNPLSDRFLVSNSFLNLRNINLGYSLPANMINNLSLTSLTLYVAMENVYYIAARKGLDVQQNFVGTSSFNYFPYRTVMFGLKLGL